MDSSDTSEEENNFEYWADWRPSEHVMSDVETCQKLTSKVSFGSKKEKPIALRNNSGKFGNWIPPSSFYDRSEPKRYQKSGLIRLNRSKKEKNCHVIDELSTSLDQSRTASTMKNTSDEANICCESVDNVFNVKRYANKTGHDLLNESKYFNQSIENISNEFTWKINSSYFNNCLKWEKVINVDWGERKELHDVTACSNEDLMWGVVCPGIFTSIKLWQNEYGNICGSAEGKISKEGSPEISFIYITDVQNLRKMLHLTNKQWAFIVEMTQKIKIKLNFEAYVETNLQKMNFLEKLWYFICKRRHFFPDQCLLVKFSGAIKSLKDFKIIPKLTVQNVRDITGQDIS